MMKKFRDSFLCKTHVLRKSNRQSQIAVEPASQSGVDGLQIVYEGQNSRVDLVAIHGQGGNWKTSWTDKVTGTFWLGDILPEVVPESRILSYGYGASKSSVIAARDLLTELDELRKNTDSQQRPVIFLAHSFGGVLLKGTLAMSYEMKNTSGTHSIFSSTYGILFFGVPQQLDKKLGIIELTPGNENVPNETPEMQALKRDFKWLQESNIVYSRICERFAVKYFTETAGDHFEVPLHDGNSQESENFDSIVMHKSHGKMIKFSNKDDTDFKNVCKILTATVAEALESKATKANQDNL
ncbi:hypothetical protein F5884DRAFT_446454 [Xylogone sp. PMI_703]|nr:hypothetical protein F5884DRAFT_446454 [Xylogone sp. PMI_703]